MKCQYCTYEGPREEFPRNMSSIYTTASGVKPRTCNKCNEDNFFPWGDELEEDEKELKALCLRMDDSVKSGKPDILLLKRQVKEMRDLNRYLNAEWVNEFIVYIYGKIKETQES